MVCDRMPDLLVLLQSQSISDEGFQQAQNPPELQEVPDDNQSNTSDEKFQQTQHPPELRKLLDNGGEIHNLIYSIVKKVSIVKDMHTQITDLQNKEKLLQSILRGTLETNVSIISKKAFRVQRRFNRMRARGALLDFNAAQDAPVYTRIKTFQYINMSQWFSEVMEDCNNLLIQHYPSKQGTKPTFKNINFKSIFVTF